MNGYVAEICFSTRHGKFELAVKHVGHVRTPIAFPIQRGLGAAIANLLRLPVLEDAPEGHMILEVLTDAGQMLGGSGIDVMVWARGHKNDVFAVENLALDARFTGNPAVAGDPHFRFYAGAPVIDPDGFALGSLCVINYKARGLDQDQTQTLLALAQLASDQVRLHFTSRQLRWALKMPDGKP